MSILPLLSSPFMNDKLIYHTTILLNNSQGGSAFWLSYLVRTVIGEEPNTAFRNSLFWPEFLFHRRRNVWLSNPNSGLEISSGSQHVFVDWLPTYCTRLFPSTSDWFEISWCIHSWHPLCPHNKDTGLFISSLLRNRTRFHQQWQVAKKNVNSFYSFRST